MSSNVKDIGIIYLKLALFSGLLGTAFSVLVRRCALFILGSILVSGARYLTNIATTSGLVGWESSPVNIACLVKAFLISNQVNVIMRVVIPMVKVKLLESNSEGTYKKELVLACDRHYITSNGMWERHLEGYVITRVT